MKSEWRVTSNVIGGQKMYAVYRLIDVNEPDHSGNREYAGDYVPDCKKHHLSSAGFASREIAEFVAEQFNEDEA